MSDAGPGNPVAPARPASRESPPPRPAPPARPEPPERPRRRPRRTGRGPLGCLFTLVSVPVVAALWVWALAWTAGESWWRADLLANLAAQGLLVTAAAAAVWLLARRPVLFTLALLACLMHVWIIGTGRAAWWPRPVDAAVRTPGTVRMLHYNASHKRGPDEVLRLLEYARPDVAALVEPSIPLQMELIHGDALADAYPHRLKRHYHEVAPGDRIGASVLLSRWPLEPVDVAAIVPGTAAEHLFAAVVEVPADVLGATAPIHWGVIGVHPRSPRTPERWLHGNEVTRAVAAVARKLRADGLEVVVLTDLNSTPTGWRSRHLFSEARLRRAKPVLAPAGTYPAQWDRAPSPGTPAGSGLGGFPAFWPGTVAIDDALVTDGIAVCGWDRLDPTGSDHWPVVLELAPAAGP